MTCGVRQTTPARGRRSEKWNKVDDDQRRTTPPSLYLFTSVVVVATILLLQREEEEEINGCLAAHIFRPRSEGIGTMVLGTRHCFVLLLGVLYCALLHVIGNLCTIVQLPQSAVRVAICFSHYCFGPCAVNGVTMVTRKTFEHGGLL